MGIGAHYRPAPRARYNGVAIREACDGGAE